MYTNRKYSYESHPTDWRTFLGAIESRLPQAELRVVEQAGELLLARTSEPRGGHCRTHGLAVAEILSDLGMDSETIAAGLLLACVEETRLELKEVEKTLGHRIAWLIQGAGRIAVLKEYRKAARHGAQTDKLRKMLLTLVEDPRVVVIRLADQLYLLRVAKPLPEELLHTLAQETLDLFAPLAGRLGIWQIKWELEDLAFCYLEPEIYQRIALMLDQRRTERERYINAVITQLQNELRKAGIEGEVSGRPKHIYSIWNKMQRKEVNFHQIFDVLAVRILVHEVADCYAALGLVHSLWQQIPEEFDDYIAKPKANMYRSLHTTVIGPEGRTMEVQIRTYAMHRHAELGIAAHWRYKEEKAAHDTGLENWIAWLRAFLENRDEKPDRIDWIEQFKAQAFHNRIYVLTPQGHVIDLPVGATPLDFAYAVHTELGHRCRGAKVDGVMVPLVQPLKSGQQVEILTAKEGSPSRDWLNPSLGYLKSREARAKVRRWFKQQDYDKHVTQGRAVLDRERRRLGIADINLGVLARHFEFKRQEDFLAALGRGHISAAQISNVIREQLSPQSTSPPMAGRPLIASRDTESQVLVLGVSNLLTRMAGCCKPVPDDSIVGYITQGQGVTIHRRNCTNLLRLMAERPHRLIDVAWGIGTAHSYPVDVVVKANDRRGLLRDVSEVVTSEQVNILAVSTLTDRTSQLAHMHLILEISSAPQLDRVLKRLARVADVIEARRKV